MKHTSVFIERASPGHYFFVCEGHVYFLLRMEKAAHQEAEAVMSAMAMAACHGIIWAISRLSGTSSFHLGQIQVTKDAEHVERSVVLPVLVSLLLLRWQGRQPVCLIRA